jgi:voltage-gated potassium channel
MFKDKKKMLVNYEIFMAVLALVIVAILFIEFTRPLTESQEILLANIDLSILIIFAVDYFYRLAKAKEKWHFIKSNIFDLIAIMPFDKAFRIARLARLTRLARLARTTRVARLLRLTKIIRLFAFARRFGCTFSGVLKTNGLAYVVMVTFGIVFMGAFGIMAFEDNMQAFGDALWWSLVTTTTVGYGDISPESAGGRILAGLLMIVGIGFLGMVTGSVATYFVDRLSKKECAVYNSVMKEHVEYIKNKLDELDSLSREDIVVLSRLISNVLEESQENLMIKDSQVK